MNRKEAKAKRYSIVAVVALCAVLSSMLVMRHAAKRMTNEILHITAPTTTRAADVENEVTNVPDPRATEPETEPTDAPSTEETTAVGTAINLTVFNLPRLSVDIDLDFVPNLTREETVNERERLTEILKGFSPEVLLFSETMQDWRTHSGVDFSADAGCEIHSVGNGRVSKVISDPQRGYTIEVDYGTFTGRYCAISQENAVGIDTELHTGDVIGTLADLPLESADPPHLHFEALQNGVSVDPMDFLEQ